MDKPVLHNISLSQFKKYFPESPWIGLGDDFYIMDVKLTERHSPLSHPCRFDGFMIIYCIKGHIRMNVNLNEFELKENMLFVNVPGNIIKVNEFIGGSQEDVRYGVIAMSNDFMGSLKLDVNKIFTEGLSLIDDPAMTLSDDDTRLMRSHIELMMQILSSEILHKKEIINTQMASILYLIAGMWSRKPSTIENVPSSRGKMIFEQFLKLVTEYHTQYRNVGFYADKLCLTPKYLSKLVRNASGRSAPEWIDAYVILEAKNLLKHSNISIKDIVYRLNFPNQSVFYKFFKARTGMTPSGYRNS